MQVEQIRDVITRLLRDVLDEEVVQPSGSFVEAGIDSMSVMDLLFKVEKTFGVEIPDDRLSAVDSIDGMAAFIEAELGRQK